MTKATRDMFLHGLWGEPAPEKKVDCEQAIIATNDSLVADYMSRSSNLVKLNYRVNSYFVYVNVDKWDGNVSTALCGIYKKCGYMGHHFYQQVKANLNIIKKNHYIRMEKTRPMNKNNARAKLDESVTFVYELDRHTPKIAIKKVIFDNPATIVYWDDKTKTVAVCQEGDTFDEEKGLAICISKKVLGNNYAAGGRFKKALNNAIRRK